MISLKDLFLIKETSPEKQDAYAQATAPQNVKFSMSSPEAEKLHQALADLRRTTPNDHFLNAIFFRLDRLLKSGIK